MNKKILFLVVLFFESSLWCMEDQTDWRDLLNPANIMQMQRELNEIGQRAAEERQRRLYELLHRRETVQDKIDLLIHSDRDKSEPSYLAELDILKSELRACDRQDDAENNFITNVGNAGVGIAKDFFGAITDHARHKDELETAVAKQAVQAEVEQRGAMERFREALRTENLTKVGIFLALTAAGVFGSYYALTYLYRYFEAKMGMPTLIRDSSRFGWKDVLLQYFGKKNRRNIDAFSDVVLAPHIAEQVFSLAAATALTHEKGLQYRHLLLYGPPGTGKTLVAKTLAYSSGMDYAIISGADFSQFKPGTDVQKLHEVFDWADKGARGLILFIDEADALLRDRKHLDERGIKLVDAFLSRTNASSDKFMVVLATNYPEVLDSAVLSRINKKVSIPLPTRDERIRLLKLYTTKYLLSSSVDQHGKDKKNNKKNTKQKELVLTVVPEIDDAYLTALADRLGGFSGRDIDQLLGEIRIEGAMAENNTITQELFDRIVANKIEQHNQERTWEEKQNVGGKLPAYGKPALPPELSLVG